MNTKTPLFFIILAIFGLFPSCEVDDLRRLPDVRITLPISIELNNVSLGAEIINPSGYPIDGAGFEVSLDEQFSPGQGPGPFPAVPNGNTFNVSISNSLDLSKKYFIRAYIEVDGGVGIIYSPTIQLSTTSFFLSASATIRGSEAAVFGSVSDLPNTSFTLSDHGYIWRVFADQQIPEDVDLSLQTKDDIQGLGTKAGSGQMERINVALQPVYTYLRPYAIFQEDTIYGNILELTSEWTQINFDTVRQSPARLIKSVGFALGDYGYVCTGEQSFRLGMPQLIDSLWRYDPSTKSWMTMENFLGGKRRNAVAFTINDDKAYVGLGFDENNNCLKDFYAYDPDDNSWVKKADFPATSAGAVAFEFDGFGYVATGIENCNSLGITIYKFDPNDDSDGLDLKMGPIGKWTSIATVPGGAPSGIAYATGFALGDYGYISTGWTGGGGMVSRATYQIDPTNEDSMQRVILLDADKTTLPGNGRRFASSFVILNKAYVGLGTTSAQFSSDGQPTFKDFYAFDNSAGGEWKQVADISPNSLHQAASFSIGGNGYIYGGVSGSSGFFEESAILYIYTPIE